MSVWSRTVTRQGQCSGLGGMGRRSSGPLPLDCDLAGLSALPAVAMLFDHCRLQLIAVICALRVRCATLRRGSSVHTKRILHPCNFLCDLIDSCLGTDLETPPSVQCVCQLPCILVSAFPGWTIRWSVHQLACRTAVLMVVSCPSFGYFCDVWRPICRASAAVSGGAFSGRYASELSDPEHSTELL